MTKWFDEKNNCLCLDEMVVERDTFKKIMADQFVSEEELKTQSELVIQLLQRLEKELNPAQKTLTGEVLAELAVLFTVHQYHLLQTIRQQSN